MIKVLPARVLRKDRANGVMLETYTEDRRDTYYVRPTSRIFWNLVDIPELTYVRVVVTDDKHQDLVALEN